MAYCTKADLERVGHPANVLRWADDDGDGVLSADEELNVTEAIVRAYNRTNCKLGKRYAVPFATVPGIIKNLNVTMALFYLARRIGYNDASLFKLEFDQAEETLDDLAAGDEDIPGVADLASAGGNAIESTTEGAEPEFSATKLPTGAGFDGTLDRY